MADKKPSQDMLDWLGISNAPNWRVARPLGWFIGAVLTVALPLLFFASLAAAGATIWHTITLTLNGEQDGINLGAGALIAALLGAPFVIWGTVLKHQTVRYQKEGHITDRINKAVEQLGAEKTVRRHLVNSAEKRVYEKDTDGKPDFSRPVITELSEPNIEVRIGAILSLERIAQDSTRYDNGRDHVRVMEILCAYVRENAPANEAKISLREKWELTPKGEEPGIENISLADFCADHGIEEHEDADEFIGIEATQCWSRSLPEPRSDIAQTLKVLGRRTADQRQVEAAWPDLGSTGKVWPFDKDCPKLRKGTDDKPLTSDEVAAFQKAVEEWRNSLRDYSGYRLDLRGANLQRADLSAKRPDASDGVFSGALLQEARLEGARLRSTRMEGANLVGARMHGANLSNVQMQGGICDEARLEGARMIGARLQGAYLGDARMQGATLDRAAMEATRLMATGLEFATLDCANLTGAVVNFAKFKGATFTKTRVGHVDFSQCSVSADQMISAIGDRSTKLPKQVERPANWPD